MDFTRWLRGLGRVAQRRVGYKSWLHAFFSSNMMRWDRSIAARGVAIGMFWTWIPMPLQMFPAAVFCWLFSGNLPLALACVWLSNPLTYLPIFALEYSIGRQVLDIPPQKGIDFGELAGSPDIWGEIFSRLQDVGVPLLAGALVMSLATSVASYLLVSVFWKDRLKAGERLKSIPSVDTDAAA